MIQSRCGALHHHSTPPLPPAGPEARRLLSPCAPRNQSSLHPLPLGLAYSSTLDSPAFLVRVLNCHMCSICSLRYLPPLIFSPFRRWRGIPSLQMLPSSSTSAACTSSLTSPQPRVPPGFAVPALPHRNMTARFSSPSRYGLLYPSSCSTCRLDAHVPVDDLPYSCPSALP